jgi:hypothetical protein
MQQPREVLKQRERTASLNVGFAFNISVKEPSAAGFAIPLWCERPCRTTADKIGAYDDEEQSLRRVLAGTGADDILHRSCRGERSPCRRGERNLCRYRRSRSRGPSSAVERRLHDRPWPERMRRTHVGLWQSYEGRTIRDCALMQNDNRGAFGLSRRVLFVPPTILEGVRERARPTEGAGFRSKFRPR